MTTISERRGATFEIAVAAHAAIAPAAPALPLATWGAVEPSVANGHDEQQRVAHASAGEVTQPRSAPAGVDDEQAIAVVSAAPAAAAGVAPMLAVVGTSGDDSITGTGLADQLAGLQGSDTLSGLGGADTLSGDGGNNSLQGGPGADTYVFDPINGGADTASTGDNGVDHVLIVGSGFQYFGYDRIGNDLLISASYDENYDPTHTIRIVNHYAGAGIAYFEADFGADNTYYGGNPDITRFYTPHGLIGTNQGANAELIVGTSASDVIKGNGGQSDWLFGQGGNDTIYGGSTADSTVSMRGGDGNDSLVGGSGSDDLWGDAGNDTLDGGLENIDSPFLFLGDRADYRWANEGITVDLNLQGKLQFVSASQGSDELISIEGVRGTELYNDTITGDANANFLYGFGGEDSLVGGGGNDYLVGDFWDDSPLGSDDTLIGGSGADTSFGGFGDDSIDGGNGDDSAFFSFTLDNYAVFTNNGVTTVTDFNDKEGTDTLRHVEHLVFADQTVDIQDQAPSVTGPSAIALSANQAIKGSDLFTGATDPDGAITKIQFWDSTPGDGYLTFNGVRIVGSEVEVAPADIDKVGYVAGSTAGSNSIVIDAIDDWGVSSEDHRISLVVDGGGDQPPEVSGPTSLTFEANEIIAGSQLFKDANDPDGAVTTIQFWDSTPGAGYLAFNGVKITTGHIDVAPADVDKVSYVTGSVDGTNVISIDAIDNQGIVGSDHLLSIRVATGDPSVPPPSGLGTVDLSIASPAEQGILQDIDNVTYDLSSTFLDAVSQLSEGGAEIRAVTAYLTQHPELLQGTLPSDDPLIAPNPTGIMMLEDFNDIGDIAGHLSDALQVEKDGFQAIQAGIQGYENGGVDEAAFEASRELLIDLASDSVGKVVAGGTAFVVTGLTAPFLGPVAPIAGFVVGSFVGGIVASGTRNELESLAPQTLGQVQDDISKLAGNSASNSMLLASSDIGVSDSAPFAWTFNMDTGEFTSLKDTDPALYAATAGKLGFATGSAPPNLTLSGDPDGAPKDDLLIGALGADHIDGRDGNDVLAGLAGNDQLTGGAGDDVLFGGSGNDALKGGDGTDCLEGGAGKDTLIGGKGNDTYIVDSSSDKVTELANEGTDMVQSSVTFSLAALAYVENLTLTGSDNVNGTGNAQANIIIGNDGGNVLDGGKGVDDMAGGLGDDVYFLGNAGDKVTELGDQGNDTAKAGFSVDLGEPTFANIENAVLLGTGAFSAVGTDVANALVGNASANKLTGNGGNDTLDGGTGSDTLIGGLGDDIYVIDRATDVVSELADQGNDTVKSLVSVDLGLPIFANIENVTLLGAAAVNATGNVGDNVLIGNAAANKLDGKAGADTMDGGAGNDTYVVDDAQDKVVESIAGKAGGIDLVVSAVSFSLGAPGRENIENLTLTGGADSLSDAFGNALNNKITGNAGSNILDGDVGADTLIGGLGDDIYFVDNVKDVITEGAKAGTDLVGSYLSYVLSANLENLALVGVADINGTGNSAANHLEGNVGDNILDGKAGADTMSGEGGDDTYVLDNPGDVVVEEADGGVDTVKLSATVDLGQPAFANIENVVLQGAGALSATGTDVDNALTGNGGANHLAGNGGNDTLDGGAGSDTLTGGLGDDTYVIDKTTDVVIELADQGNDTVKSFVSIDLNLPGFANIENVTLLGAGATTAIGNSGDNILIGGAGANKLSGGGGIDTIDGGLGNDTVTGGAGDDQINVSSGNDSVGYTSALDGHDVIDGFDGNATGGQDTLNLDALFDALGIATANRAALVSVAVNGSSADVSVDADGNAGNGFELLAATLNTSDAITVGQDVVVGSL